MKKIKLKKIKYCQNLLKSTPKKNHYKKIINENCIFIKDEKAVGIYIKIDGEKLKQKFDQLMPDPETLYLNAKKVK